MVEADYLILVDMIDDRNILSHTYDAEEFKEILNKFPKYAGIFQQVERVVTDKLTPEPPPPSQPEPSSS